MKNSNAKIQAPQYVTVLTSYLKPVRPSILIIKKPSRAFTVNLPFMIVASYLVLT